MTGDKTGSNKACNIHMEVPDAMVNSTIYAEEGFFDVDFICNGNCVSGSSDDTRTRVFCNPSYDSYCFIDSTGTQCDKSYSPPVPSSFNPDQKPNLDCDNIYLTESPTESPTGMFQILRTVS